jgi:hypothetical protein
MFIYSLSVIYNSSNFYYSASSKNCSIRNFYNFRDNTGGKILLILKH